MQDDTTVRIPLRARDGSVRAYVIVGTADADFVNQWRWSLGNGYAMRWKPTGSVYLHRELLGLVHGDGLEGDHIDRDHLNCQRSNLRVVSHAGNMQNHPSCVGSTSQHRGVSWHKATGKWLARIKSDGRNQYLGIYADEMKAAEVARDARRRLMPFTTD